MFSTADKSYAQYCDDEKTVYIFLNNFASTFKKMDDFKVCLTDKEIVYRKNMFVLKTLFHETEHAKQFKYVDSLSLRELRKKGN